MMPLSVKRKNTVMLCRDEDALAGFTRDSLFQIGRQLRTKKYFFTQALISPAQTPGDETATMCEV